MQLAYSIDHVSQIGRAEPQHLYSLNNLFSNHVAEGEVRLCLCNEVPQAKKHLQDCMETFQQSVTEGRTDHDLVLRRKERRNKERENRNKNITKDQHTLICVFIVIIGMRQRLFTA